MINGGFIHYKMTRKEPNQYTSTEMSSNSVNMNEIRLELLMVQDILYKMTGLEPNQYTSTEMSPNQ